MRRVRYSERCRWRARLGAPGGAGSNESLAIRRRGEKRRARRARPTPDRVGGADPPRPGEADVVADRAAVAARAADATRGDEMRKK